MHSVEKSVNFISTQYETIFDDGVADHERLMSVESEVDDVKRENKELKKPFLK